MPLLETLQTDLTSLKYTSEGQRGTEPLITVDVADKIANQEASPIDEVGSTFLLKSGVVERVIADEERFIKYFQTPSGLNFIAKQNILSRSQVKSQASGFINDGVYLPTSTLAQIAVNPTGGHLVKQGLNPFANTQAVNKARPNFIQDIGNFQGVPAYAKIYNDVVGGPDGLTNRLVELKDAKIATKLNAEGLLLRKGFNLGQPKNIFSKIGNGIVDLFPTFGNVLRKNKFISKRKGEIAAYDGGPGSILGVGKTRTKRYVTTVTLGTGGLIGSVSATQPMVGVGFMTLNANQITTIEQGPPLDNLPGLVGSGATDSVMDFRKAILDADPAKPILDSTILSRSPDYTKKGAFGMNGRVNLGDPGSRKLNRISYTSGSGQIIDRINALQIYKSTGPTENPVKDDFVKFRFGVIQNNNPKEKIYIHFRAFLDEFSDNYTSEWTAQKYMGRAENFYRYSGFDRQINLGFTVAAQSKDELIPMYQKLNFLASTLAPDYTDAGYMAGNLVTLTLGGFCYEQPGFINGLTLSPMMEAPWEIAINDEGNYDDSVKEMAHIVSVSGINFTPIHNFVPQINKAVFGPTGAISSYGEQKYIALDNGRSDNYKNISPFDPAYTAPPPPKKIVNTVQSRFNTNVAVNNSSNSQGGNNGGVGP